MKFTDQGIFLNKTSYSDSSLITTFYTKKEGLQKFLFRGGKKKAYNIFPLSISELSFYGNSESGLKNLTHVEALLKQSFQFDPVKSTIAFFISETIMKCVHEGDPDIGLFNFAVQYIEELESTNKLKLFPISFLVGFSHILGFKPLIDGDNTEKFNLDAGTFNNLVKANERVRSGQGVNLIASLLSDKVLENTNKTERVEALEIMLEYFMIHIPRFRNLESYEIIKETLHI